MKDRKGNRCVMHDNKKQTATRDRESYNFQNNFLHFLKKVTMIGLRVLVLIVHVRI